MASNLGGKWAWDPVTGDITEQAPTREDVIAAIDAWGIPLDPPVQVQWTHELEAMFRQVVREELRRVGLRPPVPSEYGVWRWNAETDAWERSDG